MDELPSEPRRTKHGAHEPRRLYSLDTSNLSASSSPKYSHPLEESPEPPYIPEQLPARQPPPTSRSHSAPLDPETTKSPLVPQTFITTPSTLKRPWWKPRRLKGPLPDGWTHEWPYCTKEKLYTDVAIFVGLNLGLAVVPGGSIATAVVPTMLGFMIGETAVAILRMKFGPKKQASTGGEAGEEDSEEENARIEKEEIIEKDSERDGGERREKVAEVIEMKDIIKEW